MESIVRLMKGLPANYETICKEQGAIVRRRGVSCPEDLMMLALFHLHNGCTLMEISEVARLTKLGEMSDVAFMNRFEHCGNWFKAINEALVREATVNYNKPQWMSGMNVVAVDASDVTEKGRSGRTYRVHYELDIFKMVSVQHLITTNKTSESLCHFSFGQDDLVIADRAYATIKNIMHCEGCGARYLVRMRKNSFTLRNEDGEKIDLTEKLCALRENGLLDFIAYATNLSGDRVPVRVVAKKKPIEAIKASRKRIKRAKSKKQISYSDEAITFNDYFVLITNIEADVSPEAVLQAYRLRWQVEIHFKRLKSILNYGDLPKRRENSAIAWLNGKIMVALLIEKLIAGLSFPPQDNDEPEYLEGD